MKFVTKKGITKTGGKQNVFDKALCNRIRNRLKLSKEDLPDKLIKQVILRSNELISDYIINNADGYRMEVGFDKQKPMGFLMVSKYLPKEFRETKEEHLDRISKIEVSELFRKQLYRRYNVDVGRVVDLNKLNELQQQIPHLNLHTYFFRYRIMWFNHRNCKSKKGRSYYFKPIRPTNKKLFENVLNNKQYHEANFHDFYAHKIKSKF